MWQKYVRAELVIKGPAWFPYTPTIRVQILLKSPIFLKKLLPKRTKIALFYVPSHVTYFN